MEQDIRAHLFELQDLAFKKFSSALVPGTDPMIGVRLPQLRALSREIAAGDWRAYLESAQGDYFEEIMLQGMVIGAARAELEETLRYIAGFVPKLNNWSTTDSFCAGLKAAKNNQERFWDFLQPYLIAREEFGVRFGVVMLLFYFVTPKYIVRVLPLLDSICHDGYYAKMAVAWALSICYTRFPSETMALFQRNSLDAITFNKALQKSIESRCVTGAQKQVLRAMKRK